MRRWDLACVVGALLAMTLWIDFSSIHRNHCADSLVMSLISLYRWTPLYWEQNRLGMLVPALAVPFHDPFTNLLVQSGIVTFSGLGSFFLLGYYVAGRRRGMVIGAAGALLFVVAVHLRQQFNYLIYVHQYGTSLSLSLLGLIALGRWQSRGGWWWPLTAVVLIWLALWVNVSLTFALGPLVLLRRWLLGDAARDFDRLDDEPVARATRPPQLSDVAVGSPPISWRGRLGRFLFGYPAADWIALAATASGLLLSMAISRFCSPEQEQYHFLPPREWLACAVGVLRNLPEDLHKNWLAAVGLAAASGLATLRWPAGRQAARQTGLLVLGLMVPAAVQFAFMTSLDHVHRSDYSRYIFASVFLWQGACLLFAVVQWTAVVPDSPRLRRLPYMLLVILCVAAAARYGRPGLEVVRKSFDENPGTFTAEVLAQRCTHVAGDYGHVWPTVFHANRILAEQGTPYTVWGIAHRCGPTAFRWTQVPMAETRIAEIIGEESHSHAALNHYGIASVTVEYEGVGIRVLRPAISLSETWAARQRR